jgi:hypothetical protein
MLTPRRFVSIQRTIDLKHDAHTLDAIADDGTAWWMVINHEGGATNWRPPEMLPPGSEPD